MSEPSYISARFNGLTDGWTLTMISDPTDVESVRAARAVTRWARKAGDAQLLLAMLGISVEMITGARSVDGPLKGAR